MSILLARLSCSALTILFRSLSTTILLKETVARALEKISLVKEKEALLEENKVLIQGQRTRGKLNNIIGRSPKMQALYQMIETVAQVQSTVLVTGESGTGKELVARAIHDLEPARGETLRFD